MSLEIQFGKPLNTKSAPYVMDINDDADNVLEITVALSKEVKVPSITVGEKVVDVHNEIFPDEEKTFRIIFNDYLMYQVRDESFSSYDEMESRQGDFFCLVENSQILNRVEGLTIVQKLDDGTYFPGVWKHYAIMSQNHVIDIISTSEPDVLQVEPEVENSQIKHSYSEFENSELWNIVKESLNDLIDNQDIEITTKEEYVIGYLCKKISERI